LIYEANQVRFNAVSEAIRNNVVIFSVDGGLVIGNHGLILKASDIKWTYPPLVRKNVI